MDVIDVLDKCGECGIDVGDVHKCPVCNKNMHAWCGAGVGDEGYGQLRQCSKHADNEKQKENDDGDMDDSSADESEAAAGDCGNKSLGLQGASAKSPVFKRKHSDVYEQFDINDGTGKNDGKMVCVCKNCKRVVQASKVFNYYFLLVILFYLLMRTKFLV